MLRPTVCLPVCPGIKHPSGVYDQILITVRQLGVCWCRAFSLTSGRVCRLQLLMVLASAVIFGSESLGTRDHILLSQIRDFPFRRLLRLARLRWRYSTRLHTGLSHLASVVLLVTPLHELSRKHRFEQYLYCCMHICCRGNIFTKPLPRNISTRYNIIIKYTPKSQ
jgi:hypothetical protein